MKRNDHFLMQEVAGKFVVVPVGTAAADFPGMITLNETGVVLWNLLEQEQTEDALVKALMEEYEAPEEQIREDIRRFTQRLIQVGAVIA